MWLVVFRTYKQSFLDTVITHPVSKEEPADTVRLLIVLLDNFADNRILTKYIHVICVRHCLSIGETSAEVHSPTLKLLLYKLHKF